MFPRSNIRAHEFFRPRLVGQKLGFSRRVENIVSTVDGLRATQQLGQAVDGAGGLAHHDVRVGQPSGVEQIGRQRGVAAFVRLALEVVVREQAAGRPASGLPSPRSLSRRGLAVVSEGRGDLGVRFDRLNELGGVGTGPFGEAEDDDVHVRLAARVRAPGEGAVGEVDLQAAAVEQHRPELRHLLALRDGIGGHEADARGAALDVAPRGDEPRRDVVQRAAALARRGHAVDLCALGRRLVLGADERRVAEDVVAVRRRQHRRPVQFQGVAVHDARRGAQRNAHVGLAELQAEARVHDVVHNPQRGLRDARRKLAQFDAEELVHVHDREIGGEIFRGVRVRGGGAQFADDLDLQRAQLAVGDDEEVAAAARRVQEAQRAEFVLETLQRGAAVRVLARPQPLELGAQVVQEQRLDDLQDVLLGGVVGALGAAGRGLHDGLEQRAEDGGRDGGPVEAARVEQRLAHGRVEVGNAQRAAEQGAVDVREARQIFVQRLLAAVLRRVEHLEQPRQPRPQVRAVLARAGFQQVEEDVARLEDAGVVREQAEDGAHQEPLQVVAGIAGGFQRVVQAAHAFGRAHVDRVLIPEGAPLHAQDEAEGFDVAGQVGQGEARFAALVAVEQHEGLGSRTGVGSAAGRVRAARRNTYRPVRVRRPGCGRRSSVRPAARRARTGQCSRRNRRAA